MKTKITMRKLAEMLNIDDFENPCEYDMSDLGIRIKTLQGFKPMNNYVVKHAVDSHYILPGGLKTTSAHRTLVEGEWIRSRDRKDAEKIDKRMQVVDMSVPDGESYIAGGHINHNTTPGGFCLNNVASLSRV